MTFYTGDVSLLLYLGCLLLNISNSICVCFSTDVPASYTKSAS